MNPHGTSCRFFVKQLLKKILTFSLFFFFFLLILFQLVFGPAACLVIPPAHFCSILNPVQRDEDTTGSHFSLRLGHKEFRFNQVCLCVFCFPFFFPSVPDTFLLFFTWVMMMPISHRLPSFLGRSLRSRWVRTPSSPWR